ncbi:inorganic pyrophosphatase [Dioszegia hungarica]|uniref:inorganic diphosphatase n=1 Tax=Dioszegia hungarica TaxID=4972 RepID=A0AA38HC85_9TREE|nr:inorganic pyrophosphatase [Dioszegia hungarica]KAI9637900.1 inorganic pyrophosphatase [Dioszegia hungarica]
MLGSLIVLTAPVLAAAVSIPKRANDGAGSSPYSLRTVGARNTLDWRVWLEKNGQPASFWHDVPLYPDEKNKQIVNFVVEVPRWEDAKIEIRRQEPLNPIFHDDRNDLPRFVESVWPHKSYPFHYGSIPQTWESPNFNHSFTGFPGDNDPMDLFDIGQDLGYTGQIKQVKILGALAVNDGDETDWKVLAIDIKDPLAALVNDYLDVERYRPGTIAAYRDWWTYYKVARGDDVIPIVGEWYQDAKNATAVVAESHTFWWDLVKGNVDTNTINYNQTSYADFKGYADPSKATATFKIPSKSNVLPAEPKPSRFSDWYYLYAGAKLVTLPKK